MALNPSSSRRGLSRRDFLKLAGGTAGLFAASCASPRPGVDRRSDQVQLVYQDWRTEWFPAMAQRALETFQAKHPNIRVYYTPDPDNIQDRMLADMQAGTAPDVLSGCCETLPAWAQRGYLLDLSPFVAADLTPDVVADWDPAQYKALSTSDGVQFALPKYHGALALYYNKDLFDESQLPYPDRDWTHDDYLTAMRRLTRRGSAPQPRVWGSMCDIAWDRVQIHINGWGGHLVDPADDTLCRLGDQESLAAMEWLRARMWDDRVMASFLDVQNSETRHAFIQGRLAMVEDGSWALKDILENAPFRVGVSTFPAGPAGKVTLATTDGFAVYAGTRHPEAAWELVKFLAGLEYGRAMSQAHLLQPARYTLVEEWVDHIRNAYPDATQDLDIAAFAEGHELGYSVTAEVFANQEPARQLVMSAWEEIFTLGRAPVSKMKSVAEQVQAAQGPVEG